MNIKDFILKYNLPAHEAEGLKDAAQFWARSNFEEKLLILVYCLTFGVFPGGIDAGDFEDELSNNIGQFINDLITSENLVWSSLKTDTEISTAITNLSNALQNLIIESIATEKSEREAVDQGLSNQIQTEVNDREDADLLLQTHLDEHTNRTNNPHQVTKEQIGLGNVKNEIQLTESDIINADNSTLTNKPVSAAQVALLRQSINTIQTLLNSNDTDLDTVQEIVNFIKANKGVIDQVSTSKISYTDIVDDFGSELPNKVASAGTVYRLNQTKRNIGAIPASEISQDATRRFVTDLEKAGWEEARTPDWSELQNVPSSFPPASHNHNESYYTKSETDTALAGKRNSGLILATEITQDATHRFVTDSEKAGWSAGSTIKIPKFSGDWTGKILPLLQKTIALADPDIVWKITFPGTHPSSNAFMGGILLSDGRVFCVPYCSTTARIFDPVTNSLTTPGGTYPGTIPPDDIPAFAGGVLLSDGRVFVVPYGSTTARIYDPVANSVSTPGGTYPGAAAFLGGILLPDGRVFLIPYLSTTARIYDPVANSVSTPGGTYPGGLAFAGAVLLPDGRVFLIPSQSTTARIYDPVTNSVSTPGGAYPGGNAFFGGVLLPDNRVFCVPCQSTSARIYDPVANSVSTPGGTYPGGSAFMGGVLLPDGRVFCIPLQSTTARIYDPVANSVSTPGGTYPGTGAFIGGVLMRDGRVFCVPHNSATAHGIATTRDSSLNFPLPLLLSPFLNKL
ncbi:hypothetical protein QMM61_06140 [Leptospira santarosai]|uniref:hypothetical protein n=1 Tax=Leptospira santarosai TaxID=28183 RepID=UPI0024AF8EA7|nr:hypothetical protein [Leptospira santarosai]MDI7196285.1 hypothetical protein [Leptospira santarosai]